MSLKVPFRLARRASSEPASAVIFPGPAPALEFCAAIGLDPTRRTFALADGLLLKLESPSRAIAPQGLRLRSLAPDLLVPADADLVPALLEDEAAALAKGRGLVFLPSGRVLAYDPRAPLAASDLLAAPRVERRPWTRPPEPEPLAERVAEFVVEGPGAPSSSGDDPGAMREAADRALDPEDPTFGSEEPRPDPSGAGKGAMGHAAMGAGKGLLWLGGALGLQGLSNLGAKLIQGAIGLAPRLSEAVLGRQSAALRELLREFREGDTERALRRALPLNDPPGRGASGVVAGGELPTNDLTYRLDALLRGPGGRGPMAFWRTEIEVRDQLAREYHRAAAEALARGDSRRAAYIYGRLLGDFRAAANALLRGGLYRDAAAVFLARLGDHLAAARAFESAGDFDRALALYRQVRAHESAGDLLRRIGQPDEALVEYRAAARILAEERGDHLAAGNLLKDRAGRADLAEEQYLAGWRARPRFTGMACGQKLAELYAGEGRGPELLALADEAADHFAPFGNDAAAGNFLHELVRLADAPEVAPIQSDLRDRVRMPLAGKLRQHAERGRRPALTITSALLGGTSTWSPPAVRDAEFALAAALRRKEGWRSSASHGLGPLRDATIPGTGPVTACVASWDSEEVFVGFAGGEVFAYRPRTSEVVEIARKGPEVASLAVSADGRSVAVLRGSPEASYSLSTYRLGPAGEYHFTLETSLDGGVARWLTPIVSTTGGDLFGLWYGVGLGIIELANLTWRRTRFEPEGLSDPLVALLIPTSGASRVSVLSCHDDGWYVTDLATRQSRLVKAASIGLREPSARLRSTVTALGDSALGLALLGPYGTLGWNLFAIEGPEIEARESGTSGTRGGYRAAAILGSRLAVAATEERIDWLALGEHTAALLRTSGSASLPGVIVLFPSRRTGELIAVGRGGEIRRLSMTPPPRAST